MHNDSKTNRTYTQYSDLNGATLYTGLLFLYLTNIVIDYTGSWFCQYYQPDITELVIANG